MKFIDEATIEVTAGNGGNGCAGFRREKYVPQGGPDGGDGGHGGSVIFKVDRTLTTLMDVKYQHHFRAEHGRHGKGSQKTGRSGENKIVKIPLGTVVYDAITGEPLADLNEEGVNWVVAHGGKGGLGNIHFVTSTHQAPREFTMGEAGEHKKIRLELKLLADVGLVGFPNAGKSTLISSVSNARPKIADYPFTTKAPNLGLVRLNDERSFVMADIPGIIEGAHEGAGMGMQFLRHIERTRVIVHLVDITDPAHMDPINNYKIIRGELAKFNDDLVDRPEIVVLTKMDISEAKDKETQVAKKLKKAGAKNVVAISAVTHSGLDKLLIEIGKELK